jgi:uncharacterized protein (DUF4213/DUF364 family)
LKEKNMLIDKLIEYAQKRETGRKIKDIRAGLGYTGVMLDDGACGLAYTFRNEMGCGCGILSEAGSLIGRDAAQLIPWSQSKDRLRAAVGLGTINACLNDSGGSWNTGNVSDAVCLDSTDTFGMIGEFRPILSRIKDRTKNIYVFEQNVSKANGWLYPDDAIPEYLPKCDVVMITSTSIINHTFDDVIGYCKNAREVYMVGASTPLCPEAFDAYNVTMLAGSVVTDPEQALLIVSQGGGTMSLKPAVKHVLVKI